MTADQENHLAAIKASFNEAIDKKYRAGQAEHNGNLWENPALLDEAMNEVLDLWAYLHTLKERISALTHR